MISARVIPTASAAPTATARSATAGSVIRVVAMMGGGPALVGARQRDDLRPVGRPRRRGDPARPVVGGGVAEREAEVVDPLADRLGRRGRHGVVGGQAHADREAGRGVADRGHHRLQQARPVRPAVVAVVELGRHELGEQVAVGGRELDPVEPAGRGERRGVRVAGHDLVDLARPQGARLGMEAEAGDRRGGDRGRPRRRRDELPPAVEELDEQPRAVRLHGRRDPLVAGHDLLAIAGQRVPGQAARRMHGGGLDHDHPGAAARAGLVVGDHVRGREVAGDERGLVGRGDDPVAQLHGAERQRAEEVGQRHQCSTRSTPRRSSPRATISRWISDVPSQMRSTRSSRRNRSATFVRR